MAYTLLGVDAIDRAGVNNHGSSYLYVNYPATHNGIIKEVQIFGNVAGSCRIKIYSDDGSNYVLERTSTEIDFGTGLTIITGLWLPIRKGWYFGEYIVAGHQDAATSGGTQKYINSEAGTLPKTDWSDGNYQDSIQAKVFTYCNII